MMETKLCFSCKKEKLTGDFHKRGSKLHSYCKECRKAKLDKEQEKSRKRKWYLKNKDLTITRSKKQSLEKPDQVREYKDKYYSNNKALVKSKSQKIYYENRHDPAFKEKRNTINKNWKARNKHIVVWRSVLYYALKRLKQNKVNRTHIMVGYSAKEFRNHIESLWLPGMTWDNHGEWHIDHIIPVNTFDCNADVKIVNALSNLRPLWATSRTINGIFYEGNLNRDKSYAI